MTSLFTNRRKLALAVAPAALLLALAAGCKDDEKSTVIPPPNIPIKPTTTAPSSTTKPSSMSSDTPHATGTGTTSSTTDAPHTHGDTTPAHTTDTKPATPAGTGDTKPTTPSGTGTAAPTGTSTASADPSTPKGAALAFGKAMMAGDMAGAKDLVTGSPDEMKFVDTLTGMTNATKKLVAATDSAYGDKAKSLAIHKSASDAMMMDPGKEMADAKEKIDGDSATLSVAGKDEPMKLKKMDGKWKVDGSMFKDMSATAPQMQMVVKAYDELADDVKGGKVKFEDFEAAMGKKIAAAMGGGGAPGTPAVTDPK